MKGMFMDPLAACKTITWIRHSWLPTICQNNIRHPQRLRFVYRVAQILSQTGYFYSCGQFVVDVARRLETVLDAVIAIRGEKKQRNKNYILKATTIHQKECRMFSFCHWPQTTKSVCIVSPSHLNRKTAAVMGVKINEAEIVRKERRNSVKKRINLNSIRIYSKPSGYWVTD